MVKPIKNASGGKAFKLSPEMELYTTVVTSTLNDKYYESGDKRVERIKEKMKEVSPEFVGKLAVHARNNMNLRTIPLVLTAELAKIHNGDSLVQKVVKNVVCRADEISKLLEFYIKANNRDGKKVLNKVSHQIIKGLKIAFNNFDEYQLAKYNRDGIVKLRDALFLSHPRAYGKTKAEARKKADLFKKLVDGKLDTPYTWETELSDLGQQKFADDKEKKLAFAKKWEELIDSDKLGYMALLRNLRNIDEAGVSAKHIKKVCERIADADEVKKSKQFPFRFLSAARETSNDDFIEALDKALLASAENIAGFDDYTGVVIATDVSGSMDTNISDKSKVKNVDIGQVLGTLLNAKCKNSIVGLFGTNWKPLPNIPKESPLKALKYMQKQSAEVGWSTNGHLVIEDLIKRKVVTDKVMIFTDMELYNSEGYGTISINTRWRQYREKVNPNAKIYLFDLAGYGRTPIDIKEEDGVYLIAGWSDRVFDILAAVEKGSSAVEEIEKIVV